jgi:Ca2+-binding RTX toxin-like protein
MPSSPASAERFAIEDCTILGTPVADNLVGTAFNDVICGLGGNDTLNGLGGADVLIGGTGADVLIGGTGADVLIGGTGADQLIGGPGVDTVSYADRTVDVSVVLDGLANDGETNEMDLVAATVENAVGGSGNDFLRGSLTANRLDGGPGNDTVDGSYGDDVVDGGEGQDIVRGGPGGDHVSGGDGDDTLTGGSGADQLHGGPGNDTVTYASSTTPISASINDTADDGANGENDSIADTVENLIGGLRNDALTGSDLANALTGGPGDDVLIGGTGADQLIGGLGTNQCDAGGDDGDFEDDLRCNNPPPLAPEGTIVLLNSGAWCWFEGPRLVLGRDSPRLYTSAVVGLDGGNLAGRVVGVEFHLDTGQKFVRNFGAGDNDDHNSAAIWEAPDGQIVMAWTRHARDSVMRFERRSADGQWQAQTSVDLGTRITYANLYGVRRGPGHRLFLFYRGNGVDPHALISDDLGETWTSVGRLLFDPDQRATTRPYVVYATDGIRIHMFATDAHPSEGDATSLYHGYIEGDSVFRSDGTPVGPLGTAYPVTALSPVWLTDGEGRAWGSDAVVDSEGSVPVVSFSVRTSSGGRSYWVGRLASEGWVTQEVADAGHALYAGQPDYTGLIALDPSDPTRYVISTNVDPETGDPLISRTDGIQHWELFEGNGSGNAVEWKPLTADSAADNLRPVLASAPDGTTALAWMRGTYTSYLNYRTQIVASILAP